MKRNLTILAYLLLLLTCFLGCSRKPQGDAQQIIHEIIYSFDAKGENPGLKQQLSDLKAAAPEKAAAWSVICDTWSSAYADGYVYPGILPDGLPEDDSLAIIVLGFELNADGSMKDELIGRLSTAYDCALKYPNAYLIMTGGGTAANNKSVTEADSMADWLRAKGISEDRIIVENKSMTTLENAANSFRILEERYPNVTKLAIVTSDYHVPWGVVNFNAVIQYEAAGNGSAPRYEIISNAGYAIENPTYTYEVISRYQADQLWMLETSSK